MRAPAYPLHAWGHLTQAGQETATGRSAETPPRLRIVHAPSVYVDQGGGDLDAHDDVPQEALTLYGGGGVRSTTEGDSEPVPS